MIIFNSMKKKHYSVYQCEYLYITKIRRQKFIRQNNEEKILMLKLYIMNYYFLIKIMEYK